MTITFYGTAADVLIRTGARPEDLGLIEDSDPDAALAAFVEGLLTQATDLMDRTMRKSYLEETTVPPGLDGIADDAVSDSLRTMVATRQTPVVRIDEFAIRPIVAVTLSSDVLKRLKLYAAGRGAVSVALGEDQLAPLPDILTAASLNGEFGFLEAME